ncbi:MAG: hypothetical protein MJY94_08295 [Bacteroidales bacterium]|nr:hypothetical protein [Bacteroidales bacterium]
MDNWKGKIDCPESMMEAIRHYGIVPFFKCGIPGWSIEEMTPRESWFFTSDVLGPWDWKIDVIQSGEIAYGKFIRRKAGFATAEYYGHLLNWRRAQEKYKLSGSMPLRTVDGRLNAILAPVVMDAIRENGSVESGELRKMLDGTVSIDDRKKIGGHMEKYLVPKVKKQALDFILGYLEMGCWVVTGDVRRVFRGPNNEYNGWQRSSLTAPEALFGKVVESEPEVAIGPFWAKNIEGFGAKAKPTEKVVGKGACLFPDCTPEESYRFLEARISRFFPGCEKQLEKLLKV